jgi:hypothetical protein
VRLRTQQQQQQQRRQEGKVTQGQAASGRESGPREEVRAAALALVALIPHRPWQGFARATISNPAYKERYTQGPPVSDSVAESLQALMCAVVPLHAICALAHLGPSAGFMEEHRGRVVEMLGGEVSSNSSVSTAGSQAPGAQIPQQPAEAAGACIPGLSTSQPAAYYRDCAVKLLAQPIVLPEGTTCHVGKALPEQLVAAFGADALPHVASLQPASSRVSQVSFVVHRWLQVLVLSTDSTGWRHSQTAKQGSSPCLSPLSS